MSLTPTVYPAVDSQGVETSPVITALFGQALEPGSVLEHPIVLIKKNVDYENNQIENILINVDFLRVDNTTPSQVETKDYGNGTNAGEEYRTKIVIKPEQPLHENAEYSIILPKEIGLLNVFDPEEGLGNSSPVLDALGTYKGLESDTYTITITGNGSQSRAYYSWERASDGHLESDIRARKRFIELDQGIKVRFPDGDYIAGDTYTIRVIPEQKVGTLYSWSFATGIHDHAVPEDNQSNSSIHLPVTGSDTNVIASGGFGVTSIVPDLAASRLPIGAYSALVLGSITLKTKIRTSAYNNKSVEIVGGATSGAETLSMVDNLITVGIEKGVTTNQVVIDLINGSSLGADLEATSLLPANTAILSEAKKFSQGADRNEIIVTFNKNIDATTVNTDTVKIIAEDLLDYEKKTLNFSHTVVDNKLTIIIED